MSPPIDQAERHSLCKLALELGPDAPTLCEGWQVIDLIAHLYAREHHPLRQHEHAEAAVQRGLPWLVHELQHGPPPLWRIPVLRTLLNGVEYFIHHEDVRRANGVEPRDLSPELETLAWRVDRLLARRTSRRLGSYALRLESENRPHRSWGSGSPVILRGRPSEILLLLSGRRTGHRVEVAGGDSARVAFARASLGL